VFREDRRFSMEVYVRELSKAFRAQPELRCDLQVHVPRMPSGLGRGRSGMRLARYLYYPWTARRADAELHHIADPGYGQLLYALDPRRVVVTVHDVIPVVRWRGGIPAIDRGRRPWLNLVSSRALKRAAHLIAISDNTSRDLVRYCGCDPARVTVIHHGIEDEFRVLTDEERARARAKWRLPDDGTRRVLVVGSSYYKNQQTALRAFARLRASTDEKVELVGVGAASAVWRREVADLGLGAAIREIEAVPPGQMVEIFNCADVLLFPSAYEGFGRPPVEAMACGVPVVASNAAALPEAVGEAGLLCAPGDAGAFAEQLHRVLFDRIQRQRLIDRGLTWHRQFTWTETARQTARVYEQVLSRL
jgi:glycosyltransferase involved in cell wall biosynthesis